MERVAREDVVGQSLLLERLQDLTTQPLVVRDPAAVRTRGRPVGSTALVGRLERRPSH